MTAAAGTDGMIAAGAFDWCFAALSFDSDGVVIVLRGLKGNRSHEVKD
jgi:hypothetical protein